MFPLNMGIFCLIAGDLAQIQLDFVIISLVVNLILSWVSVTLKEMNLKRLRDEIDFMPIDVLTVLKKNSRFFPMSSCELQPGNIIKVKQGQVFPADCLLIDVNTKHSREC